MFTLTISICCFWNNQRRGPGEKHWGRAVSRAQLGFHDWEAGPDYAPLGWRVGGEEGGVGFLFFKALSRFLMEGWKKAKGSGDLRELALGEERGQGEISHCRPVTPALDPTGQDEAH